MSKRVILSFLLGLILILGFFYLLKNLQFFRVGTEQMPAAGPGSEDTEPVVPVPHPFSIEALRQREYPGGDIVIEETLEPGRNYERYIASYSSDGLKIYGLLTLPRGEMPEGGFPAIVFNHGSIPPKEYRTAERYVAYIDGFARNGYIVFKIDYRGHGNSEGVSTSAYYSPDYVIDVLNAVASLKKYPQVNPEKIGMWGHSMGGHLTITAMAISPDIKAGVVWAGLVASHDALFDSWRNRRRRSVSTPGTPSPWYSISYQQELISQFGTWQENPEFWQKLAPTTYLADLSGPIQLHHGLADERVLVEFSENLKQKIESAGKNVELYTYPGTDHNLSQSFGQAMNRSIEFFDQYLK